MWRENKEIGRDHDLLIKKRHKIKLKINSVELGGSDIQEKSETERNYQSTI